MSDWVLLNDELLPAAEARVGVFDSGLLQGVGLFETLLAHNGVVFRAERHAERLAASARRLGWSVVPEAERLVRAVRRVVEAGQGGEQRVRLTVTTGSLRPPQSDEAPALTVIASASAGGRYPAEMYQKGVTVIISDARQGDFDPLAGHKTTSYFARLATLREAHARGAFEAIWLTLDEQVAEGAITNVFVVQKGVLLTPPLDTPVLPGVARAAVIETAAGMGVAVRERPIELQELLEADEVFLTNVMVGVMPVVRAERVAIGNEKPGGLTQRLLEGWIQRVEAECVDGGA